MKQRDFIRTKSWMGEHGSWKNTYSIMSCDQFQYMTYIQLMSSQPFVHVLLLRNFSDLALRSLNVELILI